MSLFDLLEDAAEWTPAAMQQRARAETYDLDRARELAFCYTSSEHGNSSGIRFMMTVPDAQKWCESDVSRGTLHGTRWAYFWTRVSTFIEYKAEYDGYRPRITLAQLVDSGEWDERIAKVGVVKIGLPDFPDVLGQIGIDVVTGREVAA